MMDNLKTPAPVIKNGAGVMVKVRKQQEMKQSLTIAKSGVTTWITPLSYDILIVAYLILLHLLEVGVLDVVILGGALLRGLLLAGEGIVLRASLSALGTGALVHLL